MAAAAVSEVNAWVGCSRTSHLHFDGLDNLLLVASGAKTVLLYSPWQYTELYPQLENDARWKSAARSRAYAARDGSPHASLVAEPCWRAEVLYLLWLYLLWLRSLRLHLLLPYYEAYWRAKLLASGALYV